MITTIIQNKLIKYAAVAAFWLLLWHVVSVAVAQEVVLVSPARVFSRLAELGMKPKFWQAVVYSLTKIFTGFFLALAAGVLMAALTAYSRALYALFMPVFNVIKSVPVASFTLLALMWVNSADLSAFVSFMMVVPVIYFNTFEGIKSTDKELLEMCGVFRVPFWRKMKSVYLKSVTPYIVSAASTGLGFAWKSGVAAEVIGLPGGTIGYNLNTAKIFLETADLFAWTIVIVILSMMMEKAFMFLLKKVTVWR